MAIGTKHHDPSTTRLRYRGLFFREYRFKMDNLDIFHRAAIKSIRPYIVRRNYLAENHLNIHRNPFRITGLQETRVSALSMYTRYIESIILNRKAFFNRVVPALKRPFPVPASSELNVTNFLSIATIAGEIYFVLLLARGHVLNGFSFLCT